MMPEHVEDTISFAQAFRSVSAVIALLFYMLVSFMIIVGAMILLIHGIIRIIECCCKKIEDHRRRQQYKTSVIAPASLHIYRYRPVRYETESSRLLPR